MMLGLALSRSSLVRTGADQEPHKHAGFHKVYVCHPFAGDQLGNFLRVQQISRIISNNGLLPVAPHIYLPQFLNEATERSKAMEMCLELLSLCDAMMVFGSHITEGMEQEIEHAIQLEIPIIQVEV